MKRLTCKQQREDNKSQGKQQVYKVSGSVLHHILWRSWLTSTTQPARVHDGSPSRSTACKALLPIFPLFRLQVVHLSSRFFAVNVSGRHVICSCTAAAGSIGFVQLQVSVCVFVSLCKEVWCVWVRSGFVSSRRLLCRRGLSPSWPGCWVSRLGRQASQNWTSTSQTGGRPCGSGGMWFDTADERFDPVSRCDQGGAVLPPPRAHPRVCVVSFLLALSSPLSSFSVASCP